MMLVVVSGQLHRPELVALDAQTGPGLRGTGNQGGAGVQIGVVEQGAE